MVFETAVGLVMDKRKETGEGDIVGEKKPRGERKKKKKK